MTNTFQHLAVVAAVLLVATTTTTTTYGYSIPEPSTAATTTTRRGLFQQSVGAATTAALALGIAHPPMANAVSGTNKVNAKLQGLGLPVVTSVPSGFQPLLEYYGKGKNRTPLLVTFSHPVTWVVTLPSNDVNGEDGTIQAGDYGKGDTATFYVYEDAKKGGGSITDQPKELFEDALKRSISQRGDNMYQNFKVTKLDGTANKEYMLADFKYQLLTGAGFEVDRKGVAAITAQGKGNNNNVQVLWAASTAVRYKKTESVLRDIVGSFRCYADGIALADELASASSTAAGLE